MRFAELGVLALMSGSLGCSGEIIAGREGGMEPRSVAPSPPMGGGEAMRPLDPMVSACVSGAPASVGHTPVRRLTAAQYLNTLRVLMKDPALTLTDLPVDGKFEYFVGNARAPMGVNAANRYLEIAEAQGARAATRLGELVSCAGLSEAACTTKFITEFGQRALRRPLTSTEAARYQALYTTVRGRSVSHASALGWIVTALLQSPSFLQHVEAGDARGRTGDQVPLTPYELASRLSYFYWNTMPDDALFAAAASGELSRPEGVRAQAERLLTDARAKATVTAFYGQLLDVERLKDLTKDATMFPGFDAAMKSSLEAETSAFVSHVFWDGDHTLSTLLSANFTIADQRLARVYGAQPGTSTGPSRVTLPAGQRAGLLTQGLFLSLSSHYDQTSPTHRGIFVRERMLCQTIAAPPANVSTKVESPTPGKRTRDRWAAHATNPACAGCHTMMDPIGFGFEHHDPVGAYRTLDNGLAVDATGELVGAGDLDGPFLDAVDLARKMARSKVVHGCASQQWLSFATQRTLTGADACATERLAEQFLASGGDLRALLLAIPQSDAFRFRAPIVPEVCL